MAAAAAAQRTLPLPPELPQTPLPLSGLSHCSCCSFAIAIDSNSRFRVFLIPSPDAATPSLSLPCSFSLPSLDSHCALLRCLLLLLLLLLLCLDSPLPKWNSYAVEARRCTSPCCAFLRATPNGRTGPSGRHSAAAAAAVAAAATCRLTSAAAMKIH